MELCNHPVAIDAYQSKGPASRNLKWLTTCRPGKDHIAVRESSLTDETDPRRRIEGHRKLVYLGSVLVHLGPDLSQTEADLVGTGPDSYRVLGEHRNDAGVVDTKKGYEAIDHFLNSCEILILRHLPPDPSKQAGYHRTAMGIEDTHIGTKGYPLRCSCPSGCGPAPHSRPWIGAPVGIEHAEGCPERSALHRCTEVDTPFGTYGRRIIPAMELPEGPTEWSVQLSVPTATKVSKDSVLLDGFLTSSAFAASGASRNVVLG